jgi:transglutaminase-like putative cysteine protease
VSADRQSARLRIRHVTGFSYDGDARGSYNEVRMTPPTSARQTVLTARIVTTPTAVQSTYRDYFGTIVTTFDLHEPHDRLMVTAESTVDTTPPRPLPVAWQPEQFRDTDVRDQFAEYLVATPRSLLSGDLLDEVRTTFGALDVHQAVQGVTDLVREHVHYVIGSTNVSSTAEDVWRQGEGVCQDMTHVTTALLRGLGIPSRYVSGYLQAEASEELGTAQYGQSHAWVEYYCGEWVAIDPTNGGPVGLNHVVVAAGRDYGDVPPIKGIYHGAPSEALGVQVEIVQVA